MGLGGPDDGSVGGGEKGWTLLSSIPFKQDCILLSIEGGVVVVVIFFWRGFGKRQGRSGAQRLRGWDADFFNS